MTTIITPSVYVFGPGHISYVRMFVSEGYLCTNELADADLVCFTGGEDVSPSLYGQTPLKTTYFNALRDTRDKAVYDAALELDIPVVGICRGGQFLNVMNGGKMWQHVNGHTGEHKAWDVLTKEELWVSSTHHQMMRPTDKAQILTLASTCTRRDDAIESLIGPGEDVEACWYPETDSLCFQPHPEFDNDRCRAYFFELIQLYIGNRRDWFVEEGDDLDDVPFLKDRPGLGSMFDPEAGKWVQLDSKGNPVTADPLDEYEDDEQ